MVERQDDTEPRPVLKTGRGLPASPTARKSKNQAATVRRRNAGWTLFRNNPLTSTIMTRIIRNKPGNRIKKIGIQQRIAVVHPNLLSPRWVGGEYFAAT